MACLLNQDLLGQANLSGGLHHKASAKRIIYLFMRGGRSHLDLWDYKSKLSEEFGKDQPAEVRNQTRINDIT